MLRVLCFRALCAAAALGVTVSARANVPEFENALRGRARAEYFEACPAASTVGSACTGTVCGKTIALQAGGNTVLRNIDIDGQVFNLHSPQNKPDLAVADLLNAQCDGSFAATSDVIAMQDMLIADVAQRASWPPPRRTRPPRHPTRGDTKPSVVELHGLFYLSRKLGNGSAIQVGFGLGSCPSRALEP